MKVYVVMFDYSLNRVFLHEKDALLYAADIISEGCTEEDSISLYSMSLEEINNLETSVIIFDEEVQEFYSH